ncbi:MAG: outer membrane protein assembly factor BamA [Victivallaceae bacterium]|nr:outer membrane protein assembly factor BamA [Victivallaceae bacterium]MDD4180426.1 outer membrane protein assembly factor BamA [Victivallaceae bacterium]
MFSAIVNKLAVALLLLVVATLTVCAAEIGKISIVQDSGQLSEEMIRFNIQLKVGDTFDENILNADIKRLHGTGFFADIVSETKDAGSGKVDITIRTKAKPTIKNVYIVGNIKYPSYELMKNVSLSAEQPLNDNQLRESANKLRSFYKEKGYNEAQITPELKTLEDGRIDVVFQVKENLRMKVDKVTFEGNSIYYNWTLKHAVANRWSILSRFLDMGLYDPGELENDKARLRELFWNKGYLDFKVEEIQIKAQEKSPEYVDINFKIFEGEPYKVGKTTFVGNEIFSSVQLQEMVRLREGEIFDNRLEQETSRDICGLYQTLGHADVSCRVERIPNFKTKVVDLNMVVHEGRRYEVKDVVITGNKITKDKVIRRELVIQPGDPLDNNRIEASQSRLMGMGYFGKVDTVSVNTDEIGKRDVIFDVEEKSTFAFKIGGGYSDTDSLLGMAEISNSNFDITDPQSYFQGGGQRFRIQGMLGLERMGFNVDFTEPWLFDIPLRLDLSGYWNEYQYDYWYEQRGGARVTLAKQFFDDFTSVALGYKFEYVRVYHVDRDESREMQDSQGNWLVSQPSISLTRDTRDSMLEPTSGYYLNFTSSITPQFLGSSEDYYRLEAKGSLYYSFLDKAIITHVGGKIGTVAGFNPNDDVPIFERYFLGGGDSIRGFPYREIGHNDINGHNLGGQSMLLLTAEVSHPIWSFIRGAVFVDVGNAWHKSYRYDMSGINVGAGYGLRIKVPYFNAPVKLDLAYPILNNQDDAKSALRFHFNMGFAF